jgi:phosphotransferase system HPr-like phosphotransfer protein
MAQVILKKSSVAARVPVAGDLEFGELALNYADGLLYYKKSDGTTIASIGGGSGGTVDLSSPGDIGATTPAAAVFTTLTATGQTSLGGASAVESLRVNTSGGSVGSNNYVDIFGTFGSGNPLIASGGTGANAGLAFRAKGTGAYTFGTGSSAANIQFNIAHTSSAVNYVQVTGAATGVAPVISAQGSDAGVNLNYSSKGTFSSHVFTGAQGNQFQITGPADGSTSANRFIAYGGKTNAGLVLGAVGSDTNVSQVFQSKGTGAIDLAAGSQGINISNGNTVTAITRTASGASYTAFPTLTISPPTTAGGVQATATPAFMIANAATIAAGGTGYTLNDVVTLVGGTPIVAATFVVTGVSGGVVTSVGSPNFGTYSVLPLNPVSVTGGTGTGLTLNATWAVGTSFNITNAGSGYVEQPTVTFSSGSAAAYAKIGEAVVVRSLGTSTVSGTSSASLVFQTPNTLVPALILRDTTNAADTYVAITSNIGYANIFPQGNANGILKIGANGTGRIELNTNGSSETNQMRIAHTASAVNYVQVTGAATGGTVQISTQGSDANINLSLASKGSGIVFIGGQSSASSSTVRLSPSGGNAFFASGTNTSVNYLMASGASTGNSPQLIARGTDTNIGVRIGALNAGNVDFYASGDPNAGTGILQVRVAPTALAVNYLQLTGAIATAAPVLSAQGTDTNIDLTLSPKGTGKVLLTSAIQIDSNLVLDTVTLTTTATTANQVLTALDATIYRAVKFLIRAVDATGTKYHTTEILAIHNGTTANSTEYGSTNINGVCATFDVDYSAATIRLLTTPASANSTVFTVAIQALK